MGRHHKKFNFIKSVGTVTKPLMHTFNHLVDTEAGIANNLIKAGGGLSLPLIIGGCVVAYLVIKNK